MLESYHKEDEPRYLGKILAIDTHLCIQPDTNISSNSATCSSTESSPLSHSYTDLTDRSHHASSLNAIRTLVRAQKISILLYLIPFGILSYYYQWGDLYTFIFNFLILIPLACILSKVTEELAMHTGELMGGIINATFGNVVEIVVAVLALRKGELAMVQASLIGSIISNLLLVLGSAFVAGGMIRKQIQFSAVTASVNAILLILASFASLLPSYSYYVASREKVIEIENTLTISHITAFILLLTYIQYLVFQLYTHTEEYEEEELAASTEIILSKNASIFSLCVLTILITFFSELLVYSVDGSTKKLGISKQFIGIVLLPIVGNAVEHLTAIKVAMHGKMELSIGIAVGSATQVSLFVMPVVVIAGWFLHQPLTLAFSMYETLIWVLSVLLVYGVIASGTSNWLEGSMLLTAYVLIGITAFWLPYKE